MIIISHRGASGLAPENTLEGIDQALRSKVDKVEIDINTTRDNQLVLFHDQSMYRITGQSDKISDLTLNEINTTATYSGHPIPTLKEALEHTKDVPLLIDCKGRNWPKLLAKALKNHKEASPSVTSRNQRQLFEFRQLMPNVSTYLSDLTKPFPAIYSAKTLGFTGVCLNFWTLNPFSYHYAKRYNLEVVVYTINRPILAKFIHFLYPSAQIITDFPNRLSKLSSRKTKVS